MTTFYGLYLSHQYTNITNYISSWYARAPNTYWNYIFVFKFKQSSYLFSLKNFLPCGDLNPGPPRYQPDLLPIELSWLGSQFDIQRDKSRYLLVIYFTESWVWAGPQACIHRQSPIVLLLTRSKMERKSLQGQKHPKN